MLDSIEKNIETYIVLTGDGRIVTPSDYVSRNECFRSMVDKEALKKEYSTKPSPEYLRLCRKFGITWERMSDHGHEVYHPKAALIFDLVCDYSRQVAMSLGLEVFCVKGTNMFNLAEPAVREHAELFGSRLYTLKSDERDFILRYAACHQQFSMMSHWEISYKQLPLGAFEIADAYRYEQSGEMMLLFRLRRLNMPDLHVLCKDMQDAYDWTKKIHDAIFNEIRKVGTDYEMLINISSPQGFEENKEFILSLLNRNKDALVHIYPNGKNFYWTLNIEYHLLDHIGRAREIATVQIDTGNAKRFSIKYVDEHGEHHYPIILHTALLGTIERYMYTVFDQAIQMEHKTGKPGYLPFWLSPEQVRIIPVSDRHRDKANELKKKLSSSNIRVGMDDRELTISKKVREAKQDWVNYMIVIGDKEMESEMFTIYDREDDANKQMAIGDILKVTAEKQSGYPHRVMYLPTELSKRVNFTGI